MAFALSGLKLLASVGDFNLWVYRTTTDALAVIDTAGYFNGASHQMLVGDMVFVLSSSGVGLSAVQANAGGVVDMYDALAVATDTD